MKQVLQYASSGQIEIADVPAPRALPGCVLVRTAASLVSAGTERAATEFAAKNLLQKAMSRPDLVRSVLNKAQRNGALSAFSTARSRLDQPNSLGYSSAGTIVEIGDGVNDLRPGDRVACAGAGCALHAEFASVPRLLAARVPDENISFDEAAFTTLGAVALHGLRTAEAKLGEVIGVIGLGLVGQLTVQLLKTAGCRVIGFDPKNDRAVLASSLGADAVAVSANEFGDLCRQLSSGYGADAVLITAETPDSGPVNLGAEVVRERGIVVAVGTVGMELQRPLFYQKEIDFRVSRSYGPGRYDSAYEQKGRDYPIGYVRWTENRNMQAFLGLLERHKMDVKSLITHRFDIENAHAAYELISGRSREPFLGVVIHYGEDAAQDASWRIIRNAGRAVLSKESRLKIGVLGAGAFATNTLIPAIKRGGSAELTATCAATGAHAQHAARKFGFRYSSTDEREVLNHPDINTVAIATRHDLHARQVIAALRAGKHVFCEKPLCLTEEELGEISACKSETRDQQILMVGFNRRFAPMIRKIKEFLSDIREPLAMHYRVNAGPVPREHWTRDPETGGGRILGEACHFLDLLAFLAGSPIVDVHTQALANSGRYGDENMVISLQFANGSQGILSYLANGDTRCSKERLEIFGGEAVAILDDFRRLELIRHGKKRVFRSRLRQDKGHRRAWEEFSSAILNGREAPIPFDEIVRTTSATFAALESRRKGKAIALDMSKCPGCLQC